MSHTGTGYNLTSPLPVLCAPKPFWVLVQGKLADPVSLYPQVSHLSDTDRCETKYTRPGDPPLPPVDSSTEQKPKGFPVPDGVDGVEGISQKPSLVIYRRPIGVVSERKRSTPVRGTHCSDSLFATLSVISEGKEFYSGQSNAGW